VDILNHKKVERVFAVGHDLGSHLLGRLAVYFPEKIEKLSFIAVGYRPPGALVNIDLVNEQTKQAIGYPLFGYQVFMTRNTDAEVILNQHVSIQLFKTASTYEQSND
jgi:soluble epoxide hydrolase / lipid-phosphate phosphatase